MTFNNAKEMLFVLQNGTDLYNPSTQTYVFLYNSAGSIAAYDWIDREKADNLASLSSKTGEEWSGLLGPGGSIYDDPSYEGFDPNINMSNLEWCEENYSDEEWMYTDDYVPSAML